MVVAVPIWAAKWLERRKIRVILLTIQKILSKTSILSQKLISIRMKSSNSRIPSETCHKVLFLWHRNPRTHSSEPIQEKRSGWIPSIKNEPRRSCRYLSQPNRDMHQVQAKTSKDSQHSGWLFTFQLQQSQWIIRFYGQPREDSKGSWWQKLIYT